jgi:ribosomal protein S6--L-glutamate ligase
VLVESRYLAQQQPAGMARALAATGCRVTLVDPDASLLAIDSVRWLEGIDLIVARGRSIALLARLQAAEAAGVPTPNSRQAIAGVLDKAHMAVQLRAAGLPTPATWIGSIEQVRHRLPAAAFPIILKPVFGDNCRGIQVVATPAALQHVTWAEPCVVAQRLLPGSGFDTKLYVIGDRVWAIRKPSPLLGGSGAVTPLDVPASWRALALKCGALFGLQLFGVDCIDTAQGLHVIEVNDFPNYGGVDGADLLLARHVAQHVRSRRRA